MNEEMYVVYGTPLVILFPEQVVRSVRCVWNECSKKMISYVAKNYFSKIKTIERISAQFSVLLRF